jgi:hypothetical protein
MSFQLARKQVFLFVGILVVAAGLGFGLSIPRYALMGLILLSYARMVRALMRLQ